MDKKKLSVFLDISLLSIISLFSFNLAYGYHITGHLPNITDPNLRVEEIGQGLPSFPTQIEFIDENNILAIARNGELYHILNDTIQPKPLLKVITNDTFERGLVGMAIQKNNNSVGTNASLDVHVFIYYTNAKAEPFKNNLFRYDWNGTALINPKLILEIPIPAPVYHNGGEMVIGPDNNLYLAVGDYGNPKGILQNVGNGTPPNDTGVIFRINPENGSGLSDNPFFSNNNSAVDRYFAYGIRNVYGLAFDPLTGNLWSSENGPDDYDEINIIEPGFNGGWQLIKGPLIRNNHTVEDLVMLPGSHYRDPVFSWKEAPGLTGLEFMKSSALGEKYLNNLFVGEFTEGNLNYFKLNKTRTGFEFSNNQSEVYDRVVDNRQEASKTIFGKGFGRITDIKTGPDGYLYIVDFGYGEIHGDPKLHRILRIVPK